MEANKSRRGKLEPDEDVREGNRPILIGHIRIGLIIMTHPGVRIYSRVNVAPLELKLES